MIKDPHRLRKISRELLAFALPLFICLSLGIVFLCTLSGCRRSSSEEAREDMVSFRKDMQLGRDILLVQRADTDTDGQNEWIVFYRFDQVGKAGPIAALIYDIARDPTSQLPVLYPYKLRAPDQNYLAAITPTVGLYNIVPEPVGPTRNEIVFSTPHELAVFRLARDPNGLPSDTPPLYHCIGFFRSDEVSFNTKTFQVTVTSGAGFERSQLVTRRYYRAGSPPEYDGYFVAGTTTLQQPYEYEVDFPKGIPATILDTPYPEKIVLAFYKTVGQASPAIDILHYLSSQAATEFKAGKLRCGSPFPLDQLQQAVVKRLSYFPTQEMDVTAQVVTEVVFASKAGQQSTPLEVTWTLNRIQGQWKMHFCQSR